MWKQIETYSIRDPGLTIEPTRAVGHGPSSVGSEASISYKHIPFYTLGLVRFLAKSSELQ